MSTEERNATGPRDNEDLNGTAAAFRNSDHALQVIAQQVADPPDSIHSLATKVVGARIIPHQTILEIALGSDARVHVIVQARDASTALLCMHAEERSTASTLLRDSLTCLEISLSTAAAIGRQRGQKRQEIRATLEEFVGSVLNDLPFDDAQTA